MYMCYNYDINKALDIKYTFPVSYFIESISLIALIRDSFPLRLVSDIRCTCVSISSTVISGVLKGSES